MEINPKIFVIIVLYNGSKWIEKCFGSLANSTIPIEILAIDNASNDGTPDIIKKSYQTVEVIETGLNLGFGKANNIGLKIALEKGCDFVFLLNQDAWIEANTISKLVKLAQTDDVLGIISPIHKDGSGDALDTNFSINLRPNVTPSIISDILLDKMKQSYYTNFVNAAAWLVTKRCIQEVGGFDSIFPHYGEDDDYINRARCKNFKVGICTNSFIFHDRVYRDEISINQDRKRLIIKNILLLKDVRYSLKTNTYCFVVNQVSDFIKLLLFGNFHSLRLKVFSFYKALKLIPSIKRSRQVSMNQRSFLG